MKKFLIFIGVALACCMAMSAKTVTRSFGEKTPITKIETSTGACIEYKVDPKAKLTVVTITAADNLVDLIRTDVDKDELSIYLTSEGERTVFHNVDIKVVGPALRSIEAASGSSITITSALDVKGKVEIEASSAGAVKCAAGISCDCLEVESSSGATVNIKVDCRRLDLEVSSAASATISGKVAEMADVEASSAAHVDLTSMAALRTNVEASSGSYVKCPGKSLVKSEVSSGAQISKE